jgi:hypothetical protein
MADDPLELPLRFMPLGLLRRPKLIAALPGVEPLV